MSVIVEFGVPTADFLFGSVLETTVEMQLALEEIVPTGTAPIPYVWATGTDFQAFERAVMAENHVREIEQLDRVGDSALYRVDWARTDLGLLDGLVEARGVVLEAYSLNGHWQFRVRFPDHDRLRQFYDMCTDAGVDIHVGRVYPLAEASPAGRAFDLTPEQREAIELAVREGYFRVPRETDLTAIADKLGISQQAASKRVRRAADKVLRTVLLAPADRAT